MFIGGEWLDAKSGETFDSVDPFTGNVWATVPRGGEVDVNAAVRAARDAFDTGPWGRMTGVERARLMRRLAGLIDERAREIAIVESIDNGKLLREMEQQLRGLPDYYHYFAGAADKLQGDTIPTDRSNFFVYTVREPLGVIGAITPWNSPLLLMTWKLAPALAAGCTVVVKPAEQAPASTLEFARLIDEAGFPPGVFNVVTGFGPETGGPLAAHPGVDKVAFTGSTATGSSVMQAAAKHVARVSLELGGKSPNIVFADADLEAACNGIVAGVFAATGQTCMAGSRLLVAEPVYDELVERVAARAREIRLGDPLDPATEMGPVAFQAHLDRVIGFIDAAQSRRREARERRHAARHRGAPGRLLRGADALWRRTERDGDRPRRGVRARRRCDPLPFRRRGARDRQRHALRARRRGLDGGRAPRAPHGARDPRRHRVDQLVPGRGADGAVRRVQGERNRSRERSGEPARVHRDEERVGRIERSQPRPVQARLGAATSDRCETRHDHERDRLRDVLRQAAGALSEVRVLEIGSLIAGPFAGRLLADFGADVIKIESPTRPDPFREWGQGKYQGRSLWWPVQSRNKKLITLDLRRGQDVFLRLVERSDLVIENFRPGTLESWGLGYDRLSEVNPGLILVRVSGYGQTGPHAQRGGFASVAEAVSGLRSLNGYPGQPPPRTGISLGDSLAGMFATIGGLTALLQRNASPDFRGQVVDVSLVESCLALLESSISEFDRLGVVREPTGSRLKDLAPSNIFRTADDRWIVIAANQDGLFRRLCEAMNRPELADDPRFATHDARAEHQEEIEAIVAEWAASATAEDIDTRLNAAGVVCGPVNTIADAVADEHLRSRDAFAIHRDSVLGDFLGPGVVPKLSGTPGAVRWSGNWQPGADNDQVFGELLGLTAGERDRLKSEGVI